MRAHHQKVDDTSKWRAELNTLASSVGLLTHSDVDEYNRRRAADDWQAKHSHKPTSSSSNMSVKLQPINYTKPSSKSASSLGKRPDRSSYSSGRLNEPVPKTRHTSRFSRGASNGQLASGKKFIVEQADREAWVS